MIREMKWVLHPVYNCLILVTTLGLIKSVRIQRKRVAQLYDQEERVQNQVLIQQEEREKTITLLVTRISVAYFFFIATPNLVLFILNNVIQVTNCNLWNTVTIFSSLSRHGLAVDSLVNIVLIYCSNEQLRKSAWRMFCKQPAQTVLIPLENVAVSSIPKPEESSL